MRPAHGATMQRRDLLLIIAEELDALGASATSLQATLGTLLDGVDAAAAAPGLWQLQEVDRLQQTLGDLSAILRRAADSDDRAVDVERLVAVMRLGSLRERLRGKPATLAQEAGTVTMF